ncbi:MAG TPA: SDR family NAD(P)-dependent oxidoreductase [Thermoanaerobaculia bacterium]
MRQIYADLSDGKLSQQQALEMIRTVKLRRAQAGTLPGSTLLASPVWETAGVNASTRAVYDERHVIVCELPFVDEGALPAGFDRLAVQADGEGNIAVRYAAIAARCFEKVQSILRGKPRGNVLVQIVAANDGENALLGGLTGLLRTAALENPRLVGQLLLVPSKTTTERLAGWLEAETAHALAPVVRYENGERQVLRWTEIAESAEKPPVAFSDDGVYLITGGLGALGLLFAREILARTSHARVVLTGRRELGDDKRRELDALSSQPGRVSYRRVDLGDREQVEGLVGGIEDRHGQLDGILHCAGMIADSFILKKSAAEFRNVLMPKVVGTVHLDEASCDADLDFFVLFSSFAGAMGNVGQADYAVANGFMDQFAAYRNRQVAAGRRRGRTRAIDWPLWLDGGMFIDPASREMLQRTTGMRPMQTATGLWAFHRSLALPHDQVLVGEGDPARMREGLLTTAAAPSEPRPVHAAPALHLDPEELADRTIDYLRRQFSTSLKLPAHVIDPHAALEQYGIDSVLAMTLTRNLEQTFGALSKTLFFEYQTIGALSEYFIRSHAATLASLFHAPKGGNGNGNGNGHGKKIAETAPQVSQAVQSRRTAPRRTRQQAQPPAPAPESDAIAIIGLSGRYPEAADINAYWKNLSGGKDCVVEVPKSRWDWREYLSEDRGAAGHHYSKWGGFIEGVDEFDPLFFNISPREAKLIDPQERLFLQHAWMAIEDAGYTRASLQIPDANDMPGQVGVYVGVMYNEYQLFGAESSLRGQRLGIAASTASVANRVSYVLNLHGPSVTVDTMCSSSLTAIHFACLDLKIGRTALALAGGVNVSIHPNKYLVLSGGQFISKDGHCQSFGEGGDGYIPGEGVGVVVLKRLSDAERDGDHIYAIIRGSALNHGGKTNGTAVPNPHAQASVIGRALAESRIDARHVSYIEAHGTGTKLGDPIEIAALAKAFQRYTADTGFCLIGSAKSNIGHCESAAGIAGVTKVVLQMQHRQIVPSLHSARLNPHIDFASSPFIVNQATRPWERPVIDGRTLPRIAGVSSFGAGGSNAHIILEEYEAPVRQPLAAGNTVVVLSARTPDQLQEKAHQLLDYVTQRQGSLDLVSVAYTLQTGREPMDERVGFIVSSAAQLIEKLQAFVAGEQAIEGVYSGQVKRNREALAVFSSDADLQQTIEKWIATGKLAKLLDLWVKGLELDWSRLYGEVKPQRASLPTYPFAREHYWIETVDIEPVSVGPASTAVLHPLLHLNTSDLTGQTYRSTFTGKELLLAGHRVDGRKSLPAAVLLEMARAAIEDATRSFGDAVVELRDIAWTQPAEGLQVGVAVSAPNAREIEFEIYSEDGEEEVVLCQGRAGSAASPAAGKLDLERLERQMERDIDPEKVRAAAARMGIVHGPALQGIHAIRSGNGALLVHLRMPAAVGVKAAEYVLHPTLIEGALQAAAVVRDETGEPGTALGMRSLRVVAPCAQEMFAWIRPVSGSEAAGDVVELDVDLCNERGEVCVQMHGMRWQPASAEAVETGRLAAAGEASRPALVRREILFATEARPAEPKKRPAIALAAPGAPVPSAPAPAARARVALSNAAAGAHSPAPAPAASPVRLYDSGNGIFSIEILASRTNGVIGHLLQALERVRQEPSLKVLMLNGIEYCFVHGDRDEYNEAVDRKLFQRLLSFPYLLIAVLPGDVIGAGFLAAALCDFLVCDEDAQYGYADRQSGLFPTAAEAALFSERFGAALAEDMLYLSPVSTGRQLREKGWTCPIVPQADVEACAEQLASTFITKSQDALRLLKQHLARPLTGFVDALTPVHPEEQGEPVAAGAIASPSPHLHLDSPAANVLMVRYEKLDVEALREVFASVREGSSWKAVVLAGMDEEGRGESVTDDAVLALHQLISASDVPVIAALRGNAHGAAWLLNLLCDACVHSTAGLYSAGDIGPVPLAAAVFTHRFGNVVGREVLVAGAAWRTADLRQRVGALLTAAPDEVLRKAVEVAESCASLPRTTLASWKRQTAAAIDAAARAIEAAARPEETPEAVSDLPVTPGTVPLRSKVVTVTAHPDGIAVVKLEDRQARNMFSNEFIEGVTEAFAHIDRTPAYKVVVLTGYDSYFAAGGTREALLAIQEGKASFTDVDVFRMPLACRLPVIAAVQGHALGAGWAMGMFADFVLLSEESRYVSPYMNYGFTPGAGATAILADKIGDDLARESLFTAQFYAGSELKRRGLRLPILPRAEVVPAAMRLAGEIARVRRSRLIALKQQLTAGLREALEETYRRELEMHEKTFVGQSDTLEKIRLNFYGDIETRPADEPPTRYVLQPRPEPAQAPASAADPLPDIMATLRTLLANELQMPESDIDDHAQFVDVGLDSISGVSWIRRVNERYQTTIEATKVYSYPTLEQFGRHVMEEAEKRGTLPVIAPAAVVEATPVPASGAVSRRQPAAKLTSRRGRAKSRFASATVRPAAEPIAVIGMAGQFPQAKNLRQYWQNLAEGRSCISRVPSQRWDLSAWYQPGDPAPGKTYCPWVGAIDEYDLFDPLFFNISPTEALSMDPQQRLFLQTCWHGIEDAGYDPRSLSGSKCGVFVGCAAGDYTQASRDHALSAQGFTGNAMSILAARISYFLDLRGPCISLDTACSSSLVAIANACDSLNSGGSDLALAGGVYVMSGPDMHIMTSQAGMLSPDGKCYSFDQRANGFVPGEGVGVVLLKRLSDAERDGDIIHGLIQGWGINQDGRTNGITAPNPESQTRLIQDVYDKHGIDPERIQLVEAHGTATKLGDPIEVEGLKQAFRKYTQSTAYCALGSVKSNIGHTLTAAGIAGVLKLMLSLRHAQMPPTIHFERLNEHIELDGSPFYVNGELRRWERKDGPRLAAISSFGFSGTNAHLVVGEYVPPAGEARPAVSSPAIFPLSARTADQLEQKARDLLDLLRQEPRSLPLHDVAYTLQVGRQAMDERLGFVAASVEDLTRKLEAWLAGEVVADTYRGQARRGKTSLAVLGSDGELTGAVVEKCIAENKLSRLLELWVHGVELDWRRLHGDVTPRRVSIPGYPFAKERYWLERREPAIAEEATAAVHPALSANDAGVVMATPHWQTSTDREELAFAEHHVILCDLPAAGTLPDAECLSLHAEPGSTIAERYSEYAVACFERIRTILQGKPEGNVLVQIVVADDGEQGLLAGLSGLLRTAALENPRLVGQLVLVPSGLDGEELRKLLESERSSDPLVRYEQGVRQVPLWKEVEAERSEAPIAFDDRGVYLVTGGLGAIGGLFAQEILARAPRATVVLTGRAPGNAETEARLAQSGGRLVYRQVDLCDLDQVRRLVEGVRHQHGRLDGILHCAGMTSDDFIVRKGSDDFRRVLAPKVTGTYNLDQASREAALDFFVLFSSVAGALGNPGQADYAAANGFMDRFAAHRNALVAASQRHGRTRSVNWPLWQEGGLALDPATRELVLQTIGAQPMQTATGLEAFHRALALSCDQMLVLEGIPSKIRAYLRRARMLDGGSTRTAVRVRKAGAVSVHQLQQELKALLAAVLGIDASIIAADQPFAEFGLDSFLGAELVAKVNSKYGTELSHARLFDYSTVSDFARFLEQEIGKLPAHAVEAEDASEPSHGPAPLLARTVRPGPAHRGPVEGSRDKVAIIGMSGRYPQAPDLDHYWRNLEEGRNAVVEVPSSRWDVDRFYDPDRTKKDKTYSKWLGALDDIDRFDPLFFRISPQEAAYVDPQHRLFLQESYRAFEDAGYSTTTLSNTKCGVYLGISTNEYTTLLSRAGVLSAPVTGNSYAIAAARIAYHLNLKGPAISVDTACSSSLVAIHLACQAILSGDIDMALAGGVSLWLTPDSYVAMSKAGMFSPDGQCKTFDDSANGIVNGEGVGAVVLKRLSDAEADGDVIYGVILGSGINQDGRTNGITAPSVNSQIELERSIYTKYGISPESIGYVEAHGTGTKLGDPIELEALATVFQEGTSRRNFCALGSVKSNIGHTTAAAGVAGLHKVLLSMRHRTLVRTLNVANETSRFDFASSPFYISRETKAWEVEPGALRRAAISSFGFSGTNAHLVVEEWPAVKPAPVAQDVPVIAPLSAKAPEQLQQKARDLRDFLRTAQQPVDLAAVAYTLQVGREPMEERLAFVVSSAAELSEKLDAWLRGERNAAGIHQGRVEPGSDGMTFIGRDDDMQEAIDKWIARGKLATLADAWARGLSLDWTRLHEGGNPRRVSLPAYPFARERCWIDDPASQPAAVEDQVLSTADIDSIEDIIGRIADDAIEPSHAVQALRMLV